MQTPNKGIYILELLAKKDFTISAKKFVDVKFPKGYYYYIGSAQKGLTSRIARHKRKDKIIHWHIDHLTTNKSTSNINSFIIPNAEKTLEVEIANNFVNYFGTKIIATGFGNSDTKETKTHLFYKSKPIPFSEFYIFKNFT